MINPEIQTFLKAWEGKWAGLPAGATPKDRRAFFEVIAREMRLPTPDDVDADTEHWIESVSGAVRVRVFRHHDGGCQPCLIYMHGGAWRQGSPETHWDITSRIASQNHQTVISIDYAKAPEHPFPAAVNQCGAVVEWVFANAEELGVNPDRIAVGGDSAGGNLAAAMTLKFRGSACRIYAQLLVYPAVEFEHTRPSFQENAEGPVIRVADMMGVAADYCPDARDLKNPLVAPLLAEDHAGLPPAYVAVAEHDPLRDDGVAYAEALTTAGVAVTLHRGTGLVHGYLRSMEFCEASREQLAAMCTWLRDVAD